MAGQFKIRIDVDNDPAVPGSPGSPNAAETLKKLESAAVNKAIQQALAAATGNSEVQVALSPGAKGPAPTSGVAPSPVGGGGVRSPSPDGERDYHMKYKYGGTDQSPGAAEEPEGGYTYKYKYKYLYKYVYKKSDEPLTVDLN